MIQIHVQGILTIQKPAKSQHAVDVVSLFKEGHAVFEQLRRDGVSDFVVEQVVVVRVYHNIAVGRN